MPQPEGNQLSFGYSPILTQVALNYLPNIDDYIGRKILPTVPTASPIGIYNIWNRGDFLRRNGKQIANYEAVPLGGFATSQGAFSVTNYGVGTPYTARDLAAARQGGMTDQAFKNAKAKWVTMQAVLELEFRAQALFQTTGNWTTTIAGVASAPSASQFIAWDQAASTPVDDVLLWKRKMRLITGFTPNTMIIPELTILALKRNPQIIARATPGFYGAGLAVPVKVSLDHIKALFEIDNILTPIGVWNSGEEGQADVIADIWTYNIMWLGYVTDTPNRETPSAGYTFAWTGATTTGLPNGVPAGEGPANFGSVQNDEGIFVREYIDNPRACVVIEGMIWASPQVTGPGLGMTWTAAVT